MKLRIIGKRGDIPFELSADEIDEYIKTHCHSDDIQLAVCYIIPFTPCTACSTC